VTESSSKSGNLVPVLTICVVSHTHWDREWYHTAGRFRQPLVALIDVLLADSVPGGTPFLLDGQAVVLEDYLQVRPEQAGRLGALLRSGALEAGPWYVLADGLIPSGEAIVRNLQAGRKVLARFGANAPAVAYCPDTFGHAQAIPTIARGFGLPVSIVWRGYGGARAPHGDTVRWQSDSGDEVLLYHLPPDGYETGSALPVDHAACVQRWAHLRDTFVSRSNTGVVLLPNGADHHALQPDIADAVAMLRAVAAPDLVVRESLSGFAARVVTAANAVSTPLPVIHGELRDSYGYTWTLGGTLGTRASQKRANAKAERALLRDVEPWLVLAWLHGGIGVDSIARAGNVTLAQAAALLDGAWRTLLGAHPHDTLCGCSVDAVARAMDVQVESAVAQARGLRQSALHLALQHDPVDARSRAILEHTHVVLRNRAAYARGGVAEMLLDETVRDVLVGPSSAAVNEVVHDAAHSMGRSNPDVPSPGHVVSDRLRNAPPPVGGLPVQTVSIRKVFRRRESPQHYPDNDLVREHRVLAWVPPVPALGLAMLRVDEVREPISVLNPVVVKDAPGQRVTVSNGRLCVHADATGVTIVHAAATSAHAAATSAHAGATPAHAASDLSPECRNRNGLQAPSVNATERTVRNALIFESARDVGDSYTSAIRGEPEVLTVRDVRVGLSGPLRGSIMLTCETAGKRNRIRVRATLSLDANADFVKVDVRGHNQRRNHRLRVKLATDVAADAPTIVTYADAAFGPVRREPLMVPAEDQAREMVPPTMPMHRWVTMSNAEAGATLHSDGLAEVEANATEGSFSLTLVRAIGELSRNTLPERPGHAGWPAAIPKAQSLGVFHARFALHLHPAWSQTVRDAIETASDAILLPLVADTMRDLRAGPRHIPGPTLSGAALRFSAATLAADGNGIVLRVVNDSAETQQGRWQIPAATRLEFAFARLDETLISAWQLANGVVDFTSPPRGVVTLRVRRPAT